MALIENTGRGPRAYARSLLHVSFNRIFSRFATNDDLQKADVGGGVLLDGGDGPGVMRDGVSRGCFVFYHNRVYADKRSCDRLAGGEGGVVEFAACP